MNLGRLKNDISQIIETSIPQKTMYILTFFAVIGKKPVELVFEQTIDNIKEVN